MSGLTVGLISIICGFFSLAWAGPDSVSSLRGQRVLVVRGLFDPTSTGSFETQKRWLRSQGAEVIDVQVKVADLLEENSQIVARAIAASNRPVLIVSHSMGGLNTLKALVDRPELQASVRGWVALSAPFHGTPLGNLFEGGEARQASIDGIARVFGGRWDRAQLAEKPRRQYLEAHASEISRLVARLPVVSFAGIGAIPGVLGGGGLLISQSANDGAVPIDSAQLPGTELVIHKGAHHYAFDARYESRVDSQPIFESLVKRVLAGEMASAEARKQAYADLPPSVRVRVPGAAPGPTESRARFRYLLSEPFEERVSLNFGLDRYPGMSWATIKAAQGAHLGLLLGREVVKGSVAWFATQSGSAVAADRLWGGLIAPVDLQIWVSSQLGLQSAYRLRKKAIAMARPTGVDGRIRMLAGTYDTEEGWFTAHRTTKGLAFIESDRELPEDPSPEWKQANGWSDAWGKPIRLTEADLRDSRFEVRLVVGSENHPQSWEASLDEVFSRLRIPESLAEAWNEASVRHIDATYLKRWRDLPNRLFAQRPDLAARAQAGLEKFSEWKLFDRWRPGRWALLRTASLAGAKPDSSFQMNARIHWADGRVQDLEGLAKGVAARKVIGATLPRRGWLAIRNGQARFANWMDPSLTTLFNPPRTLPERRQLAGELPQQTHGVAESLQPKCLATALNWLLPLGNIRIAK